MNRNTKNTAANNQELTLTFFSNHNGVPVADLYLGERRLLATTHPATIVAALYAMNETELTVITEAGKHTGNFEFFEPEDDAWPLGAINLHLQFNPQNYQFRHLAPSDNYYLLLEGLDLFSFEIWHSPTALADEHLRAAHHHLPQDLIRRPLTTRNPKGWKKTLEKRNDFVYFPEC
ncbi:hypothetical protein ACS5PN_11330 [Roseateles sp. NT4]|uniref:hypothetical protein n=1 Tax=Roseateles sp. NT4 TaxID=3453715 RepID=UPI003EE943C4